MTSAEVTMSFGVRGGVGPEDPLSEDAASGFFSSAFSAGFASVASPGALFSASAASASGAASSVAASGASAGFPPPHAESRRQSMEQRTK